MRLYLSGVKVPKLGTLQDRVIRAHMITESQKESKKTQLLALLVANSIPFDDQNAAENWNTKIKRLWNSYLSLEYGLELPEHTEKEMAMMEYYQNHIKGLKAQLVMKDGKPTVIGLDSILPPQQPKAG